jgi:hypothetical protein
MHHERMGDVEVMQAVHTDALSITWIQIVWVVIWRKCRRGTIKVYSLLVPLLWVHNVNW